MPQAEFFRHVTGEGHRGVSAGCKVVLSIVLLGGIGCGKACGNISSTVLLLRA